ncbi:MAG: FAD-dependent oxidoreductase [Candidatus Methanomethylophilaceae archaeon]|nr:FAD-dependent oxidoreductase [Candidatus Methanomethylophilaceae archaeon]
MEVDVAVIGCGPAGIQAAMHASRKKTSVVVMGRIQSSAIHGCRLDNYLGTGKTEGSAILEEGRAQAESTGARFLGQNVIAAAGTGNGFDLTVEDGTEYHAKAVVLATGISRKKLGIPGEKELFGKGVSYCAVCDCNFYKGRKAVIVGNDSEAATSAEMMTSYASETSWVTWETVADRSLVAKAEKAGVRIYGSKPESITGTDRVEALVLEDGTSIPTDGVFIELGAKSSADLAMDLGAMPEIDDTLKVGRDMSTGVPGLFACGDITGRPWQVAKAVGEGCVAGTSAADFAKGAK